MLTDLIHLIFKYNKFKALFKDIKMQMDHLKIINHNINITDNMLININHKQVNYLNKGPFNGALTQSREQSMYSNKSRQKKSFRFDDEDRVNSPSPEQYFYITVPAASIPRNR